MTVALMNERTHEQVATSVEIAATRQTRRKGLLGRDAIGKASAMLLAPCAAVHTAGMRFALDVVFVDRQGYAVKVVRNLRPWRIAIAAAARVVIEMPAGTLRWGQVLLGDRLYLAPAPTQEGAGEAAAIAESVRSVSDSAGRPAVRYSVLRRLRDTSGTSIVEAAIIAPLLLLLTLSIVEALQNQILRLSN